MSKTSVLIDHFKPGLFGSKITGAGENGNLKVNPIRFAQGRSEVRDHRF